MKKWNDIDLPPECGREVIVLTSKDHVDHQFYATWDGDDWRHSGGLYTTVIADVVQWREPPSNLEN